MAEVELVQSRAEGKPVRLCLNRVLLKRALDLNCNQMEFSGADKPVLARGPSRLYLIMPLDQDVAVLPTPTALAIRAPSTATVRPRTSTHRSTPMPVPANGSPKSDSAPPRSTIPIRGARPTAGDTESGNGSERGPGIGALIEDGEALRDLLHEASTRLARVLAGLKQHRRQSRAMRAAMQSLQLLKLDG